MYWSDEKGNIKNPNIDWYRDKSKTSVVSTYHIARTDEIELIEEQQDIDIQGIEEMGKILFIGNNAENIKKILNDLIDKQNETLEAVKKLDRKIKEVVNEEEYKRAKAIYTI